MVVVVKTVDVAPGAAVSVTKTVWKTIDVVVATRVTVVTNSSTTVVVTREFWRLTTCSPRLESSWSRASYNGDGGNVTAAGCGSAVRRATSTNEVTVTPTVVVNLAASTKVIVSEIADWTVWVVVPEKTVVVRVDVDVTKIGIAPPTGLLGCAQLPSTQDRPLSGQHDPIPA